MGSSKVLLPAGTFLSRFDDIGHHHRCGNPASSNSHGLAASPSNQAEDCCRRHVLAWGGVSFPISIFDTLLINCLSVCAAGFVRLAFFFTLQLAVLDYTCMAMDPPSSDTAKLPYTDNETPTVYWTYIEASIAIVGACLPTLRPIFVRNATTDSRVFKIGSHTSRLIPRPGLMESWDSPRTRFNPGDDSSVSYLGDRSFGIETRVEPVPLESMSYPQKGIQVQREVVNKKETARRG